MSAIDHNELEWHAVSPRTRVTLDSIRETVEAQNSLKSAVVRGKIRKRATGSGNNRKRKERHTRWQPYLDYTLTRPGIPMDESPEALYKRGELREGHLYHWTHKSDEAERNMKRPKHVGVFRVRAFEKKDGMHHYVRPQQKYLEQLYGFDAEHPLPDDADARTNRSMALKMVKDPETGVETPYHIDIFVIRAQRNKQHSQQRRIRKRRGAGAIRSSVRQ